MVIVSTPFAIADTRVIHQAKYQGSYEGMNITMTRTLTHLGGTRYRLRSKTKNFIGSFEEQEEFLWLNDLSIRPVSYRYKQKLFGISRKRSIDYNWGNLTARYKYKNKKKTIKLHDGILGPMTYQLKIQTDLLQGKESFEYKFIKRGKIKTYQFKPVGTESIRADKYSIPNAKAIARSNEGKNRKTKIWFDNDDKYTLVSLKQTKGNDSHQIFLTSSHYNPLDNTPLAILTQERIDDPNEAIRPK